MPQKNHEDLFEGSKMTFGEHLEELRVCLIRAMLGVLVGLLFGMLIANHVVVWVQGPVEAALRRFYQDRTEARLTEEYGQVSEELSDVMQQRQLRFEDVWIERDEVQRLTRLLQPLDATNTPETTPPVADPDSPTSPATEPTVTQPGPPSTDMLPVRIWSRTNTQTRSLSMYEPFLIWLKASLVVGIAIASPWIFWQAWIFVSAGLYPHEKNYVYLYLPLSLSLFFAGAALAFYGVFPPVLKFLLNFNANLMINPEPRINDWITFALFLPLGFGISFQLPLVMLFLERAGILSVKIYTSNWRLSVLAIAFVSMMLTPADPMSMVMMAVPLSGLYFLGVGLCLWLPKRRSPFGEGHDPES